MAYMGHNPDPVSEQQWRNLKKKNAKLLSSWIKRCQLLCVPHDILNIFYP